MWQVKLVELIRPVLLIKLVVRTFGVLLFTLCWMGGPISQVEGGSQAEETRAEESASAKPIDYSRDIRPILSDHCYACHGPNAEQREADLRLDVRESVFSEADSGQRAIVPGDSAHSELFRRLISSDSDERMPPVDTNKPLTAAQIDRLRQWIDQGAPWQTHWAFTPPTRPELPTISDPSWPLNPIDSFIMARLDQEHLKPSPETNRETLLRRVTFDLTGLPPSLAEIDAFLRDQEPGAYQRVVDRLLQSVHYGEHMARFWLDAARYGDTHGLHLDNYREIWPYRDWVIHAFNQNMPYDQFTIAQLAGDLLPNATLDDKIATGFNRCHVSTNEGGSIEEEVYVRNVVDRVVSTGTVFMGLTLECTRCHDHKYDPLTMHDFYSMFAFFNSIDGPAMDGNVKDTRPIVRAPNAEQTEHLNRLHGQLDLLINQKKLLRSQREPDFQKWSRQQHQPFSDIQGSDIQGSDIQGSGIQGSGLQGENQTIQLPGPPKTGLLGHYPLEKQQNKKVFNHLIQTKLDDSNSDDHSTDKQVDAEPGQLHGTIESIPGRYGQGCHLVKEAYLDLGEQYGFKQDQPFSLGAWVQIPGKLTGTILSKAKADRKGYALRVDHGRVSMDLINRADGYGIQVATTTRILALAGWHHVFVTYDGSGKAAGVVMYVDGHRQELNIKLDSLTAKGRILSIDSGDTHLLVGRLGKGRSDHGETLVDGKIDELRFYDRQLSSAEVIDVMLADGINTILSQSEDACTAEQMETLRNYYFHRFDSEFVAVKNHIDQCHLQEVELKESLPTTLVYQEREKPRQAFILTRGEYDQRGEAVERAMPAFLPPMADNQPRNRLGMAQWLVSRQHPLTARVAVNRFWAQCFGTGLVKTTENFGSQGEVPSHPKLLDWLAVQWLESGWDIKGIMKSIVMSRTYRQSSHIPAVLLEQDPNNRLLARGPRFRLDAEMLRDQALAVSGLLVPKLGGPSVKPPQPEGLWHAVGYSGSNTVRFVADTEPDKVHRRTLYTFIKRTSPPPEMSTFDGPSRESCSVRRERTNTPLQALLMMDDPQFVEAARALAQRVMRQGAKEPAARVESMLRLCTGHQAKSCNIEELVVLYQDMLAQFQDHEQRAAALIRVGLVPGGTAQEGTAQEKATPEKTTPEKGERAADDPLDCPQLAAWTMVANLILNMDDVLTKN